MGMEDTVVFTETILFSSKIGVYLIFINELCIKWKHTQQFLGK